LINSHYLAAAKYDHSRSYLESPADVVYEKK